MLHNMMLNGGNAAYSRRVLYSGHAKHDTDKNHKTMTPGSLLKGYMTPTVCIDARDGVHDQENAPMSPDPFLVCVVG